MVPVEQVGITMSALPNTHNVPPDAEFIVEPDVPALIARTAERIAQAAETSISLRGRFSLVLSGGSTPKVLYELLASDPWKSRIDWSNVHLFWEDERWLPSSNPQNNYRMTYTALTSKVPIPAANVHAIHTDSGTPEESAQQYERVIAEFFGNSPVVFDVILLGLGTNGHTASLFPHRPTLHAEKHTVVADFVEEVKMDRITLTAPVLNAAYEIGFLVTGAEKAEVVQEIVEGPYDPERLPAQLIRPSHGKLTWYLDALAAARLPRHILEDLQP